MKKKILVALFSVTVLFSGVGMAAYAAGNCAHDSLYMIEHTKMSTTYVTCTQHDHCYIGTNHYLNRYRCKNCGEFIVTTFPEEFHTYAH